MLSETPIKTRLKHNVYAAMFYSGFLRLYLSFLKKRKKSYPALILFYHRFTQEKTDNLLPKTAAKTFHRQMSFLKQWFNVIPLDYLIDSLNNKEAFRQPTVIITIDDGFKDNYDVAFPILKNLALPATIFLTSGLIDTDKAPWVDEISDYILHTTSSHLECPPLFGTKVLDISNLTGKREALHQIYTNMLQLKHEDVRSILRTLFQNLRCQEKSNTRSMLSWNEIKEMAEEEISFGAHTLSHPILSRMPFGEAVFEIEESKRVIENQLCSSVKHFAIPNGRDDDFSPELREYCKGPFDSIATTNFGMVDHQSNRYALPRYCPPESFLVFACEMARFFTFSRTTRIRC